MKNWLAFYRPYTANIHISLVLVGYLLGGGSPFSLEFWLWGIFGFCYHIFGFGHNNIVDVEYDRKDPNKQHFPLVAGQVSYRDAITMTMMLGALTYLLAGYLAKPLSIALIALAVVNGFTYNQFSKSKPAVILCAPLAKTPLVAAAYFSQTMQLNDVFWFIPFTYFTILYSYFIGGAGKDIERSEDNILRRLGAKMVEGPVLVPGRSGLVILLSWALSWIFLSLTNGQNTISHTLGIWLVVVAFVINMDWLIPRPYNRTSRHSRFFLGYLISYTGAIMAIKEWIGLESTIFLIAYFPIWNIAWNHYLYGTWLRPKV